MVVDNSLWLFDQSLRKNPADLIAGVDEAGRGPIFGPVAVGTVLFPLHLDPDPLIRDSKKMTEKQREVAYQWIIDHALAWKVVLIDHKEIDRVNILTATLNGMKEAVEKLNIHPDRVLIDGNRIPENFANCVAVKGGDRKSYSIAAASILAKVERDRYVRKSAERYPFFDLEKHKGYGTELHLQKLKENLPSPEHRLTFEPLKSYVFPSYPDRNILGAWGESWAIYALMQKGYVFLERNVRLKHYGEIDLIMKKGEQFILIEVKTSGPNDKLDPEEWITEHKIKKMLQLSELYFYKLGYEEYQVRLDVVIVKATNWRNPSVKHYADIIYGKESELDL